MSSVRRDWRVWGYIGINSFGGPAGQIAVMHREVVDRRGWVDDAQFNHALSFCMLLPGPEAMQLATYLGWVRGGVRSALVAGSLFVVPGAVIMLALVAIYAVFGDVTGIQGLLFGIQAAVIAIVLRALWRVAGRTVTGVVPAVVAVGAFAALFFGDVAFPLVILAAALIGLVSTGHGTPPDTDLDDVPDGARRRAARAAAACLVAWLLPVVALVTLLGADNVFAAIARFFSQVAVISFGGAYAALAYVTQVVVEENGWLTSADMVTGLGLAETTPGPLVLVLEFVGFLAAFNAAGGLPPVVAGIIGAAITVWVTFLPSFVFIFAGAPYVERLRHNPRLQSMLAMISAAVVGVIANLALWFFLTTAFPDGEPDWPALVLATVAAVLIFAARMGSMQVLGISALLGLLYALSPI